MQCQGPNCTKEVEQLPGGHRARKYCSDACRVAAHRAAEKAGKADRVKDNTRRAAATKETKASRERQEIRNRYADLSEALIDLLLYAKQSYGLYSVSVIGAALVREQLSLEEARKEASDFAAKYYQLKEQVESTSASIAANGEKATEAEKTRAEQELERLRNLIAKRELALTVQSETVIKRGVTIRNQEQTLREQQNQLEQKTDELEMAEEKIQRLQNQLERIKRFLEANQQPAEPAQNKQQAAIERARDEIRMLYQVSITVAEENRDNALKQVVELTQQLQEARHELELAQS